MDNATPNDGYSTNVVDRGPDQVQVQFVGATHTSTIRVTCDEGKLEPQIDERDSARRST